MSPALRYYTIKTNGDVTVFSAQESTNIRKFAHAHIMINQVRLVQDKVVALLC